MFPIKRIALIVLTALILSIAAAALPYFVPLDDEAIRTQTISLIGALINNDSDKARSIVSREISDEELSTFVNAIAPTFEGITNYDLTAVSRKKETLNGVTNHLIRYRLTTEDIVCYLDVLTISSSEGLSSFNFHSMQKNDGSIPEANKINVVQLVGAVASVFIGLLQLTFVIWMIVDCIRRKMKRKLLWLLLIALGNIAPLLQLGGGKVGFGLDFGLMVIFPSITLYGSGGFALQFAVPLGALIYFCRRKRLTLQPEAPVPEESSEENTEI